MARQCNHCGSSPWEWEEDPQAYQADLHHCRGCELMDVRMNEYRESEGLKHGRTVRLFRTEEEGVIDVGDET